MPAATRSQTIDLAAKQQLHREAESYRTYEVDKFVSESQDGSAIEVEWEDYPGENTWEPVTTLKSDLGEETYNEFYGNMVRRIASSRR